jgi:hypothetical protein
MIKDLIAGFIWGIVVMVAGTYYYYYYYFVSGRAPLAVADPMMPFERKTANMVLDAHIEREHVGEPPLPADEPNLLAGADVYRKIARCAKAFRAIGLTSLT